MFLQWRFLTGERLRDAEYTMIVRREPHARRTTCGDTLFFFLSDAAQDEFVQFLTNAAATSLYDERKHNRDKTFRKTEGADCGQRVKKRHV